MVRVAVESEPAVVIQRSQGCLIIPLPVQLEVDRVETICRHVIDTAGNESADAIIFDASATTLMDSQIANHINDAAKTLRLLGVQVVLSGLDSGLCTALVRLDMTFPGLSKAVDIDHAFDIVRSLLCQGGT